MQWSSGCENILLRLGRESQFIHSDIPCVVTDSEILFVIITLFFNNSQQAAIRTKNPGAPELSVFETVNFFLCLDT